jgi:hypothetical protein
VSAVDVQFVTLVTRLGVECSTADEAWERCEHLTPMLFRLLAAPSPGALAAVAQLMDRVVPSEVSGLLAQAGTPGIASRLGDVRNLAILEKEPAKAALADAAQHIAEVWAAPGDAGNEPLPRARAAAAALASAWLMANNRTEEEAAQRVVARLALTAALRGLYPKL